MYTYVLKQYQLCHTNLLNITCWSPLYCEKNPSAEKIIMAASRTRANEVVTKTNLATLSFFGILVSFEKIWQTNQAKMAKSCNKIVCTRFTHRQHLFLAAIYLSAKFCSGDYVCRYLPSAGANISAPISPIQL